MFLEFYDYREQQNKIQAQENCMMIEDETETSQEVLVPDGYGQWNTAAQTVMHVGEITLQVFLTRRMKCTDKKGLHSLTKRIRFPREKK